VRQLPEARRCEFDTSASPHLVQGWDTFRPWSQGIELGKVTEAVAQCVCDGFEGAEEAMDSCIDQREGVDQVDRRA